MPSEIKCMVETTKPSQPFAPLSPAQRGAQWLLARMRADGSIAGASSVGDYYKAPFGLLVTGHVQAAEALLGYIARSLLRDDGSLDGAGLDWFDTYYIYPHGWLTIAAVMRGHFETANSLLRTLVAAHDESTGAFFGTLQGVRGRDGPQELMSSSIAGLACLWAGRLDIARRTGQWMQALYDSQPDLSRGLYFVWDPAKGLVTEFPAAEAVAHRVDCRATTQWYFQYGISAAFLSSLAAATAERHWLELAGKYLRASRHCRDDVYRQPQSGKIAWGAAWTYRLTGDSDHRAMAQAAADGLRALQSGDGWWSSQNVYERQAAPTNEPNIDVTAEFVGLLGCTELVLASSAGVPAPVPWSTR